MTAGNASGVNDGAVALIVCSGDFVEKHGLKPLARVVGAASAGVEPRASACRTKTAYPDRLESG